VGGSAHRNRRWSHVGDLEVVHMNAYPTVRMLDQQDDWKKEVQGCLDEYEEWLEQNETVEQDWKALPVSIRMIYTP
jgi:hypothetical protein